MCTWSCTRRKDKKVVQLGTGYCPEPGTGETDPTRKEDKLVVEFTRERSLRKEPVGTNVPVVYLNTSNSRHVKVPRGKYSTNARV